MEGINGILENWRGNVPLVVVRRGDGLETLHIGAAALVDSSGRLVASAGSPDLCYFLRSAAKPFQVLPLIERGAAERFGFPDDEIAVMAGSHNGEAVHTAAVAGILRRTGIEPGRLRCGIHPPLHRPSAEALLRAGRAPDVLQNNCSGKHAGMLALAAHLGADLESYTEADHPVQRLCLEAVAACCGVREAEVILSRDGCTVPTFGVPLAASALGYARLVDPSGLAAGRAAALARVARAMRGRPDLVGGTDRLCTDLMREFPDRILVKVGAEGFLAAGFRRDGVALGLALKVADGHSGAVRAAATLEALRQAGGFPASGLDSVRRRHVPEVRTLRGQPAGRVEPAFRLE